MSAHVDLDKFFDIEEHSLFVKGNIVPKKKALVVGNDVINIVSNKYKVIQPKEVYESFTQIPGLTIDKVVNNPHTGGLLLSSKIAAINGYEHSIVFYTGHNGKYCTFLSLQTLRLACMNQCPTLIGNKSQHLLSLRHLQYLDLDHMRELIEEVPMIVSSFGTHIEQLQDTKLTLSDFVEIYFSEKQIKEEQKDKVNNKIITLYHGAQGQDILPDNSAIKAYNTITFMNTHNIRKGKSELEKRHVSNMSDSFNWFDILSKAA